MISLRPSGEEDLPFELEVYASTRAEELEATGWDAAQRGAFVRMQFDAQRRSYRLQFPGSTPLIIERDGVAVGRLFVDRSGPEILVLVLSLLPAWRGQGIGAALLQDLQAEAAREGKPVRLHVETFNRARRLYERLGFTMTGEQGFHIEMQWRSPLAAVPAGAGLQRTTEARA